MESKYTWIKCFIGILLLININCFAADHWNFRTQKFEIIAELIKNTNDELKKEILKTNLLIEVKLIDLHALSEIKNLEFWINYEKNEEQRIEYLQSLDNLYEDLDEFHNLAQNILD
jgi:hypothetical protein